MKFLTLALSFCATVAAAETPAPAPAPAAPLPGFAELELPRTDGPALQAVIWFPASGGQEVAFGANPVFAGVPALDGATPGQGSHPVVLMSHGLGGHYRSLGWLGAGLAAKGALVVAVNHPGSTFGDMEMPRGMAHWTRVGDLSAALDAVLADPVYGPLADPARISAVGFSYGGWTALSAGGLQGNLRGNADHCATQSTSHCRDLARWGFDFSAADPTLWDASHRDPRIGRVAAIDPGLTWGVTDVSGLAVPALLVGLGAGPDRLVATDTSAAGSGLADRLLAARPDSRSVDIAPAAHFTALLPCTENGAAILADEGDDPVCTDPAGTDRAAVHARIVAEVADFLGL